MATLVERLDVINESIRILDRYSIRTRSVSCLNFRFLCNEEGRRRNTRNVKLANTKEHEGSAWVYWNLRFLSHIYFSIFIFEVYMDVQLSTGNIMSWWWSVTDYCNFWKIAIFYCPHWCSFSSSTDLLIIYPTRWGLVALRLFESETKHVQGNKHGAANEIGPWGWSWTFDKIMREYGVYVDPWPLSEMSRIAI
jgi:hypothetical protein